MVNTAFLATTLRGIQQVMELVLDYGGEGMSKDLEADWGIEFCPNFLNCLWVE